MELPSQIMENFCWEWDVVAHMSAHVDTGAPLPRALFDKLLAARNFQSGMQTVRQLEFALFDMLLHAQWDPRGSGQWPSPQALAEAVRREIAVVPRAPYDRVAAVVRPHLRRRLCRRLLQLQVGRGAFGRRL